MLKVDKLSVQGLVAMSETLFSLSHPFTHLLRGLVLLQLAQLWAASGHLGIRGVLE